MRAVTRISEPGVGVTRRQQGSAAVCALCGRAVGKVFKHHLVPKSEGGTQTVDLCAPCHKMVHVFFTNRTLARELCSFSALRKLPEIQRYLAWVSKQPDRHIPVRERHHRRQDACAGPVFMILQYPKWIKM